MDQACIAHPQAWAIIWIQVRFNTLLSHNFYTTTTQINVLYYSTSISAKPCTVGAMLDSNDGAAPTPVQKLSDRRLLITKQAPNRRLLHQADVSGQAKTSDSSPIRLPVSYKSAVLTNETTLPGVKVSTKPLRNIVPYA